MLVPFCYVVLRRLLQLATLRGSVERLQRAGNCHPPARTRHSPSTASASRVDDGRPDLPRSGESVPLAGTLAVVHDHARDLASLASALGGEAVDIRASRRPTTDATRDSRPGTPSRARQSAVGYQRIVGELKGLGTSVSATTVRTWLRAEGLGPSGTRRGITWREFVRPTGTAC